MFSHKKKLNIIIVLCICRQLILTLFHMIQVVLNDDNSCLVVYCLALHTTISFLESNVFINHAINRNNTSKYISEIFIYIILVILRVTIEVVDTRKVRRYQRVNISRKSKKDRQCNGIKKKDNDLQNIMQKTKDRGWTRVLRKGKLFLFHTWHSSCYC